MRLGQLARKLDKKPQELVDFLVNEHQIKIESDLNTKVEGEALSILSANFKKKKISKPVAPSKKIDSVQEVSQKDKEDEGASIAAISVEEPADIEKETEELGLSEDEIEIMTIAAVAAETDVSDEPIKDVSDDSVTERIARVGEDGEELPELIIKDGVIKAPKPELDGFKVVGKIDLPTKKRGIQFLITNGGETQDVTEAIYEKRKVEKAAAKKKAFEARKAKATKKTTKRARKTLTDEDRKAFEVKRAERKRKEAEKEQALKRKKHYEENVQKKAAASSKKKKEKEIEKAVKKQKTPKVPEPTTTWGKFKKWLNT
ncbi:MAG: hypothetical protein AB8B72_12300 [Crocinitomicaceae bacterium]